MTADLADPEVSLAVAYAPSVAQPKLAALFAFDARMATILRTTTDPMIGQMRLTWWHDAVAREHPVAGEPVLAALAEAALPAPSLQRVVEGWEALLDGEDDYALRSFASERGGGLFAAAAGPLSDAVVEAAGAGWALCDLARHHSKPVVRDRALKLAAEFLADAPTCWTKPLRVLGMLAKLARRDLNGLEPQGSPRRIAALAALALTGR